MKGSPSTIAQTKSNLVVISTSIKGLRHDQNSLRFKQLINAAETAYLWRRFDVLGQVANSIVEIPDIEAFTVGCYYRGLVEVGKPGNEASLLLEKAESTCTGEFRPKILLSLAADRHYKGELDEALELYTECAKAAKENHPSLVVQCVRMHAYILSQLGENKSALGLLESLLPVADSLKKHDRLMWFEYINSYSEETRISGQKRKAWQIAQELRKFPPLKSHKGFIETLRDCYRDLPLSERGPIDPPRVKQLASHHKYKFTDPETFSDKAARLSGMIYANRKVLNCSHMDDTIAFVSEQIESAKTTAVPGKDIS